MVIAKNKAGRRGSAYRLLRVFIGERRAATMIEFALVMVPFFLLMFGVFEVGLVFWGTLELENATDDAARLIRTGQAQQGAFTETRMKQEVCNRATLLAACTSKLRIDIQNFVDFSQMAPPSPLDGEGRLLDGGFSFDLGAPQEIVLMSAFYEWPLINFMSSVSLSNMASGNRLLRASAAFRNEPFPENR